MSIRKFLVCLCAPFAFVLWSTPAHAGLKFGTVEHVRFVANITLEGPKGEKLFLARKIAEQHFLLPYSIEDQGYVLGISGESKRYYVLPEGAKLEALQLAGYLPKPLPPYELDTFDKIMGHLLWIGLVALALYVLWVIYGPKRTSAGGPVAAPTEQGLSSPPVITRFSGKDISLPMTLYPSRKKLAFMLAGSLAFVAIGFFMLRDDKTMGYLVSGFFGLCGLVFGAQLLTRNSYLIIDTDRFTVCSLYRTTIVPWRDVNQFRIANIGGGNKLVGWNYAPGYTAQATGRAFSAKLSGVEGALPDTYGMKIDELCEMMNELKVRHSAAQAVAA